MSSDIAKLMEKVKALPPLDGRVLEARTVKLDIPPLFNGHAFLDRWRYEDNIIEKMIEEFVGRKPVIGECEERQFVALHNHDLALETPVVGCTQCSIEERIAAGKTNSYYLVSITRDKLNGKMVEGPMTPREHNPRKGSTTYHKRVQKKWNKAVEGKLELGPERETQIWHFSRLQLGMLRDFYDQKFKPVWSKSFRSRINFALKNAWLNGRFH